jgi:hypothetical protein
MKYRHQIGLVVTAFVSLASFVLAQTPGSDGPYENLSKLPSDRKSHEIKTDSSRVRHVAIQGGVVLSDGAYWKDQWVEGDGGLSVYGSAFWFDGTLKRYLVLGIATQPKSAPTKSTGDTIDYSFCELLESQLKDMLRVGRNLRDEGIQKKETRVRFRSIEHFNFAIVKNANDATVAFQIEHQGERLVFSGDLSQLNDVLAAVETARTWLAQQKDAPPPAGTRPVPTTRQTPRASARDPRHFVGKYPETMFRVLTDKELRSWGTAKARYALNEIYARHGYVFKDNDIQAEFERWDWYAPRPGLSMERIEREFSATERANARALLKRKNRN